MKKLYTIITILLIATSVCLPWQVKAQSPEKLSYQAVIRDASDNLVTNTSVGMQISILQESVYGASVYIETQTPTTNANGLVSIEIGEGSIVYGTFSSIDWGNNIYFIKTETDPTGGSTYTITGTSQLLSVPYALHANKAEDISGTITSSKVSDFQTTVTNNADVLANTAKNTYPSADQTKLAAITGTNTGDETASTIKTKLGITTLSGSNTGDNAVNTQYSGLVTNATHTGDATGSDALTLATVNSDVGTFNKITINAKGLAIAGSNVSYLTSETDPIWTNASVNYYTKTNMQTSGASQLHFDNLTNTPTTIAGYGITDAVVTTGNQTIAGDKTFSNKILVSQQGIGTAEPDASSALEISSTTQGFLPPRMTHAQRDAITPIEGLIVYNTTTKNPNYYDGLVWRNYDGSEAGIPTIGDFHRGGIIAYILQSGDPGYIEAEIHGLIAAPSDQSTGAEWGCYGTTISGADGTAIGTGNQNTIDIVTGCTTAGIAAKLCYDLTLNGFSDWYLPSKDELNILYLNRAAIGGFVSEVYWSSTEINNSLAWRQNFFDVDGGGISNKDNPYYVRAVRAF